VYNNSNIPSSYTIADFPGGCKYTGTYTLYPYQFTVNCFRLIDISYDPDYIQISLYNNVSCSGEPGLCGVELPLCSVVSAVGGDVTFEYFDKDRIFHPNIYIPTNSTITVCAIPDTIVKTSGSGDMYVNTGRTCDIYPCDTPCNCYTVDAPSCTFRVEGLSWINCDGIQQYYPGLPSNPPTPAINTSFCALENTVVYSQSQGHPSDPCPVTITNNGPCDESIPCVLEFRGWAKTNLNVKKYKNNDDIPQATNGTEWASYSNSGVGCWAYVNYDSATENDYGLLYNGYAVTDSRGLGNAGYIVPTSSEWITLLSVLGPYYPGDGGTVSNEADSLKEGGTAHWTGGNDGNNITSFTARGGGWMDSTGIYLGQGSNGIWWSSTSNNPGEMCSFIMQGDYPTVEKWCYDYYADMKNGYSVRCIKD
jgi:hypothetical protein